ncbi:hypothetical protein ABR737_09625 [Streptomyces sp. Edi2]|uniref:hypothetical protein n=1 Tax=Streptomyces sp. Edi2 TaxID=3162528 RepID=UPI003305D7ED
MIDFVLGKPGAPPSDVLEVSSTTDGRALAMWKELNRIYNGEPHAGLTGGWLVEFQNRASVGRGASNRLIELLVDLEARGAARVGHRSGQDGDVWSLGPASARHAEDLAVLQALGIKAVSQIRHSGDVAGRIFTSILGTGVARSTADSITPYVDTFLSSATGQSKISKLKIKASGKRQHLFIWADVSHMDIGMPLAQRFLPSGTPDVPAHIDCLWLGSFFVSSTACKWSHANWVLLDVSGVVSSVAEPGQSRARLCRSSEAPTT